MKTVLLDTMHVRVRGQYACFNMPEFNGERWSSPIPSASAIDGIMSRFLSKKGITFHPRQLAMLFEPRHFSVASNEIKEFENSKRDRTPRTTSLLAGYKRIVVDDTHPDYVPGAKDNPKRIDSGVDYIISFQAEVPVAEQEKYRNMLTRRLKNKEQHWGRHHYLGMSECIGTVSMIRDLSTIEYPEGVPLVEHDNGIKSVDYSRDPSLFFFGTDWREKRRAVEPENVPAPKNYFAMIRIDRGLVNYPTWDEVRRANIRLEVGK